MIDVSAEDGLQIASGRHRNDRNFDLDGDGTSGELTFSDGGSHVGCTSLITDSDSGDVILLSVKFSHPVNLEVPGASLEDIEEATKDRDRSGCGETCDCRQWR